MKRRRLLNRLVTSLAQVFGKKIIDARTGECVGRAFVRFRRGRLALVGLRSSRALYPIFKTEQRVTYWRQELEFRSHPEPDYAHERPPDY